MNDRAVFQVLQSERDDAGQLRWYFVDRKCVSADARPAHDVLVVRKALRVLESASVACESTRKAEFQSVLKHS